MPLGYNAIQDCYRDYKPIFYRLKERDGQESLKALLAQTPSIQIYDTFESQLTELIKINHADRQLSTDEMQELAQAHCGSAGQDACGVWVYYPWSQKLVHLLDEADFVKVRTSRNLYKITPDELAVLRNRRIGVIGLSVGQSIAMTMATERICGSLVLADFDGIELGNMNRLSNCNVYNLGASKVITTAQKIAELDPYLQVSCFPGGVQAADLDAFLGEGADRLDLLVEECDSIEIKILSRMAARQKGIPVVMDTNDRGMLDVERFDLEPDRPLLHGKVPDLEGLDRPALTALLGRLTPEQKLGYVAQIIGMENISEEMKYSFSEINRSITGWPQLASAVTLGAAMITDTCRRIALGKFTRSGRYFVHFSDLIN